MCNISFVIYHRTALYFREALNKMNGILTSSLVKFHSIQNNFCYSIHRYLLVWASAAELTFGYLAVFVEMILRSRPDNA